MPASTTGKVRFALNHMAAPQLALADFFTLAQRLNITDVEIRNDIAGQAILDGTPAAPVRAAAKDAGVNIITINALQRFNEWTPARAEEAKALADYAQACGSAALILVPTNDGSGREDGVRQANLWRALQGLQPILDAAGVIGLVEPLGFAVCSLSSKREAAEGIAAIGGQKTFRITHDTFHHHLAGEPDIFPELTGLVHISGVEDKTLTVGDMRDAHRVLVGPADRLGNVDQLRALLAAGYVGPVSFEPFAEELRHLADPAKAIGGSMDFIGAELRSKAA